MQRPQFSVTFNLVFWLLYFLYEWVGLASLFGDYAGYFINACMALPLSLLVAYITVHILLKNYYDRWPAWQFWIVQLLVSIGLLLIRRIINYYLIYPAFFPQALQVSFFSIGKLIIELVNLYLVVGAYSLYYIIRFWYEERRRADLLEREKTLAELDLLKSQVQPHFIFNTLNNIYYTVLKTNPESAALIAHLSKFLSYNLYDSQKEFVQLSSEMIYIKNYIELQKFRFGDKIDVSVNIYDDISGLAITPMLLLPLVENCFKHGMSNTSEQNWIRLDISRQGEKYSVKIENSISMEPVDNKNVNRGLGLTNVARRLALVYPDRHEFSVMKEAYSYLVIIKIKNS